jgi:hypothetical protein
VRFHACAAELDDRPGTGAGRAVRQQQLWLDTLAKAVRLTIDAGHFHPGVDPSLFAFQLYGIVVAYYHASRLFRDPAAKAHAERAFDAVVVAARA